MKIYISGPISGMRDRNRPAFFAEEGFLGLVADAHPDLELEWVNPHAVPPTQHEGNCPPGYNHDGQHSSCCYMKADLIEMLKCDGLIMLKGWQNSIGAEIERRLARDTGIPIYYSRREFVGKVIWKAKVPPMENALMPYTELIWRTS